MRKTESRAVLLFLGILKMNEFITFAMNSDVAKSFGITRGIFGTTDEPELPYKQYAMRLGASDNAALTTTGFVEGSGIMPQLLCFNEPGVYRAWIVTDPGLVPKYYRPAQRFKGWLNIYDDNYCVCKIEKTDKDIIVYRSGDFGILIYIEQ
jgi:hypothetical protein